MNKDSKIQIELTKGQYVALAKAVYLGNWMANAQRTGQVGDLHFKEYKEIADHVFSLAPEFGLSDYFESELEFGDDENETTEVSSLHEEYDEQAFWEELCEMLGERDFYRKYSDEERQKMTNKEHFIKLQECIIAWEEEAEEYGIERLQVVKHAKDLGITK